MLSERLDKEQPMLGGSLISKPTWSNTSGCSATSAFFVSYRSTAVTKSCDEYRSSYRAFGCNSGSDGYLACNYGNRGLYYGY